jgi:RecJ-like exonuclease
MKRSRILGAAALLALTLAVAGCPSRTTIRDIMNDPGRYQGKEVAIAGHVTRSYGAVGKGIFEIDDGTGRMWVFTEKYGVPGRNAYVGVAGRIVDGFTYAGSTYGTVIHETDRRTREKG